MAKFLHLVTLPGLGGKVRRLKVGACQDQMLCVQEENVHIYSTGLGSLQHTWYADTGTSIQDVAMGSEGDVFILVNKRDVVLADRDKNKIEDCKRIRLEADATEILTLEGSNYIVFSNGGIEDLQLILKRPEAGKPGAVIPGGETICESQLRCEASGQISVTHLVSRDCGLFSITGRLVLDATSGTHTVEDIVRKDVISDIRQLKCFTLDRQSNVIMVTSGDKLQVLNSSIGSLNDLVNIPSGSKHVAIADIGENQLAFMGTLNEVGFLHTFSRASNRVTATCNMKTTAHEGRGLYHYGDSLVITGTSNVMTTLMSQMSDQAPRDVYKDKIHLVIPPGQFITREELHEHFSKIGDIIDINCMPNGFPYAQITFGREECVTQLLSGPTLVEVGGIIIELKEAFSRAAKRKALITVKKYEKNKKRAKKFYQKKEESRQAAPGVANGCFVLVDDEEDWYGEIWVIELAVTEDFDKYTGGIWPSIRESLSIAKHAVRRLIEPENKFLDKKFFHLNIEKSNEKSGHSVGLAVAADLMSLAFNTGIPSDFAFTGAINLNGEVKMVTGIKEKVEGALRAGIKTIFIPAENKKDVESLREVTTKINIKMVKNIEELLFIFKKKVIRPDVEMVETSETSAAQSGITDKHLEKITEKANLLVTERKKRGKTVPEGLTDNVRQFKVTSSHPSLHPGLYGCCAVLAVDISVADTNKIVTGGADKNATVFNKETETQVVQLKGHTKKVNRVAYHMKEDVVITGSHDNTVRVWNAVIGNCGHVLRVHDGPVTGLSLHATGDYVLTTSSDQHWTFSDINTGKLISRVTDTNNPVPLTCAQVCTLLNCIALY